MDQILDAPVRKTARSYAGFWIRLVAYIIDSVIVWIAQILVATFLVREAASSTVTLIAFYFIFLCIGVVYFAGMESSARQGTIGKMICKLKVGDKNGNPISFSRAIGRYFAKILSAITLCIGFIIVAFDSRKQAMHDMIAGTFVYEG